MDKNIIYFAGGCLWGVQAFIKTLPGVVATEAGRANGKTNSLSSDYDGYAECVKTTFDGSVISVTQLIEFFFEIIDPYSINKQGNDIGLKYRTGIYSGNNNHLEEAINYISSRNDSNKIVVEVEPLTNYVKSADEHQDRLSKHPNDYCHIPKELLIKYRK
ncbi:peptide-methionine (S)-S-oxide reductase [Romboutsia sedimentorum]|uniref:peptide-methionine (S)-S-oxide reductase n=1 Tax=Romboutsia sedimentorum TaxID=1368474 RepID=UPI0024DE83D2|nr:peptide-methionine (S)-S-oxide reductase [Romboutsia sedimentorum]MDK2584573.1 peptide-methionine (S)-S-oxide reductase [Romboutsia sedimentorum]